MSSYHFNSSKSFVCPLGPLDTHSLVLATRLIRISSGSFVFWLIWSDGACQKLGPASGTSSPCSHGGSKDTLASIKEHIVPPLANKEEDTAKLPSNSSILIGPLSILVYSNHLCLTITHSLTHSYNFIRTPPHPQERSPITHH